MSHIDLKDIKTGDLVEYQQQPISTTPARGTFQCWHSTDDGQARLMMGSQRWGMDLSVAPQRVLSIPRQSEASQ